MKNKTIESQIKDCNCVCHDKPPVSEDYNGLIHDGMCCEQMNGSLLLHGVQERSRIAKEEEKTEWILGNRCLTCGNEITNDGGLSKTCDKCWHEN